METFYERIESLRKANGISQGTLEKTLGFSNGSISKWRTCMPTPTRLQKLAEYFHVTVDYLVTGNATTSCPTTSLDAKTAETAQMISLHDPVLFEVYCSADKDRLIDYAKKLKSLRDMENA